MEFFLKLIGLIVFYRYTKTVVAAGESAQKYNPELPPTDEVPDDQIIDISNNLRTMRQVIKTKKVDFFLGMGGIL